MESPDHEPLRRLDNFVDAAFAFAVTLLVISAAAPPQSLDDLETALFNIPASAGAFVLIVLFWMSHRVFSRLAEVRDGVTTLISLAIVFTVLVYVYPLRLLMQSLFYWLSGGRLPGRELIDSFSDLASLYAVYGWGFALLSGLYALLFARTLKTATPDQADEVRSWRDSWAICAAAGLISALLTLLPVSAAPWLPPTIYSLIPLAVWARERMRAKPAKAPDAAEDPATAEA
jgi:uncharacterized membrane protein